MVLSISLSPANTPPATPAPNAAAVRPPMIGNAAAIGAAMINAPAPASQGAAFLRAFGMKRSFFVTKRFVYL